MPAKYERMVVFREGTEDSLLSTSEQWSADKLDQQAHAMWSKIWNSVSPESALVAWVDWVSHLAVSPGKQIELISLALEMVQALQANLKSSKDSTYSQTYNSDPIQAIKPDRRFNDQVWQQWPYNAFMQTYLLQEQWWQQATQDVWGVKPHHEKLVAFGAKQLLAMGAPNNNFFTNPEVLQRTGKEGGANFLRGFANFLENTRRQLAQEPPVGTEDFVVGKQVAVTEGQVILRNELIELIQYAPTTEHVHPEPILVVPAWIMKYYVLDLSPHNSLVKYLVDQGYTVFCISWKNPDANDRDLGMDEYLKFGFGAALQAVQNIVPKQKVHLTGYCIGGTLLSIAVAAMIRDGQGDSLASLSLFTAQTDFSEPGDLSLFIDESQVALLEAQMEQAGFLRGDQMSGAFQMLRPYELVWEPMVDEYLLGERRPLNDLMAWNADTTRMPAKMHSQYLRRLFLNNDLSQGRYPVRGRPISLDSIKLPIFSVGTVTDHVAPWRSVYKLHNFCPAEITFVLTNGGHNAGIVNAPGHPRRKYQVRMRKAGDHTLSPDEWVAAAPEHQGSWWPEWLSWLQARSGKQQQRPPAMGSKDYAVVTAAPGDYVKVR